MENFTFVHILVGFAIFMGLMLMDSLRRTRKENRHIEEMIKKDKLIDACNKALDEKS